MAPGTVLRASLCTASSFTATDSTVASAIDGNSNFSNGSTTSSTGRTVSHTAPGTGQFRATSPGPAGPTTVTQRACSTESEPEPSLVNIHGPADRPPPPKPMDRRCCLKGTKPNGRARRRDTTQQRLHHVWSHPIAYPTGGGRVRTGTEAAPVPDALDDLLGIGVRHRPRRIQAHQVDEHVIGAAGLRYFVAHCQMIAVPLDALVDQRYDA